MKKKILSLCLVAVLALTAIGGTLAYFTDNEAKVNTFKFGEDVDIELTEDEWKDPDSVYPGIEYAKNPNVKNTGTAGAWIRVDVILSDAAVLSAAAAKYGITDLETIFTIGEDFDSKWVLAGVTSDTTADTLTYSYYYKSVLEPKDETGELFSAVTIPAQFTSEDLAGVDGEFTITVQAHAMQDEGFDTVQEAFAVYVAETKTEAKPETTT